MHGEDESEQAIEVTKYLPSSIKRKAKRMKCGEVVLCLGKKDSWDLDLAPMVVMIHSMRNEVLIPMADDSAQSYNDKHPANYVTIFTVARPTKTNKSTTVLEDIDKKTAAGCASLMKDEIKIEAKLGKRRDAAGRIDPRQVPGTDRVPLRIQECNDLKMQMDVSELLKVFLESSENQW